MPNFDPMSIANLLRQNSAMTDAERKFMLNPANNMANPMNAMAGQGQLSDADRAFVLQAMGQPMNRKDMLNQAMQQMQGMGQMSDKDRAFLMNQGQ
jgi:uncharacterized protein (DUF1778 family)